MGELPEYQVDNDLGHQGISQQSVSRRLRSRKNCFEQGPTNQNYDEVNLL